MKVDANPGLARRLDAPSIPVLVGHREGGEVERIVGALRASALESRLDALTAG